MRQQLRYPGVYIQEVPSGVRTINSVSISVAAFVDFFRKGAMDEPIQIFGMADFEREFGGLDTRSRPVMPSLSFSEWWFGSPGRSCCSLRFTQSTIRIPATRLTCLIYLLFVIPVMQRTRALSVGRNSSSYRPLVPSEPLSIPSLMMDLLLNHSKYA
jgi:hypothetical protein